MPVIINEIEVMDQAPSGTAASTPGAAPGPVHDIHDTVRLLLRDLADRQRRLAAD